MRRLESLPRGDRDREGWRWFALCTLAFGTSYALLPLYSSNQNHHFLIGLARAGDGLLREDWLVSTRDPFPVFTTFVWFVHRYAFDSLHYIVYYLLLGAYAYGLIGIAELVIPSGRPAARLLLLAALCVLHNEVIGYMLGFGLRGMPWWQMTHWGVAEQEIFGHSAFQASSFGLLLPLALRWFLERRSVLASATVGLVVLVHFSYAITGAALVTGFGAVEWSRTKRIRSPARVAAAACVFALPAALYVADKFMPTSAAVSERAAAILTHHLPQETDPAVWLNTKAWLQVAWMVVGLALADGSELFAPLACVSAAGVALTIAQFATHSDRLALMFPWRVSVLLVPIATTLAIRAAIVRLRAGESPRAHVVAWAAIALSMTLSAGRMLLNFAYYNDVHALTTRLDRMVPASLRADFARAMRPETLPMMDAVRASLVSGNLYVIPPDLERFRLRAGAPVLADSKSHPYLDVEVLEWDDRLSRVRAFFAAPSCERVEALRLRYRVTHLVADQRARGLTCSGWQSTYKDPVFEIFSASGR